MISASQNLEERGMQHWRFRLSGENVGLRCMLERQEVFDRVDEEGNYCGDAIDAWLFARVGVPALGRRTRVI